MIYFYFYFAVFVCRSYLEQELAIDPVPFFKCFHLEAGNWIMRHLL